MFTNNVPKYLWGDVVLTAYYLINRMPTQILNYEIPSTCFLKTYPHNQSISSLPLRVFHCTSFVHIHDNDRSKLDPKAQKYIFLRYSPAQKWYKCYSLGTCKYYTSMDVAFFENQPFFTKTFPKGEKVSEDGNIWDVIAPVYAPPPKAWTTTNTTT